MPQIVTCSSPLTLASWKRPQQGGKNVRGLQIEVVVRPVEVRRHQGDDAHPVLATVHLGHLQPSDLGDRVAFVRRFQRASEQLILRDRLVSGTWIDARRAEHQRPLDPVFARRLQGVRRDHQVVVEELSLSGPVCVDAAHSGRGDDGDIGRESGDESVSGGLIAKVDPRRRGGDQLGDRLVDRRRSIAEPTRPRWPASHTRLPSS